MFKFALLVTATLLPSYNTYNHPQTMTATVNFDSLAACVSAIATRQYEGLIEPGYELTTISCVRAVKR
ncbi:MAG: hypothetical protein IPK59_08220 [Rhodospirillaceae bacterium]|nr:hypothetical protein [Rhodospirillaceae bacterium]